MAVNEQTFTATRLAISPEALPVNTLPKKIRWKHLDGSFELILSTVSSKIRLQLKQNGKPIITTTLNKLTPGQKKNLSAPRLQYQDQRMSFRYPSSSQVDNGLSERFQITLDEVASVQTVVQKLTPFFTIIAPSSSATSSQVPSGSQRGKKRGATEIGESLPGATVSSGNKRRPTAAPRPEPAEFQVQVETQVVPDSAGPSLEASVTKATDYHGPLSLAMTATVGTPQRTLPKETDPAKEKEAPLVGVSTTSPSDEQTQTVESGLASFKASLLKGYTTPTPQMQDSQTQANGPNTSTSTASFPPAPPYCRDTRISDTQLSTQIPHTQHTPQSSSSTELASQEIDLLPRSPLVDTSSPPYRPARMLSLQQETLSSLIGLVFEGDEKQLEGLQSAFPPMRTAQEEEEDIRRKATIEEEWEEGLVDQAADMDLIFPMCASREVRTIFQSENGVLDLFALDRLSARVAFTDEHLYSAISKGQISYELLELCYRVTAASTLHQREQYTQHGDETFHPDNAFAQENLQVGWDSRQSTFDLSSPYAPHSSSMPFGLVGPSSSPIQAGYRVDHLQPSSPPSSDSTDYRTPLQPPHQPSQRACSSPSHDPSQPLRTRQHQEYGYTDYQQDIHTTQAYDRNQYEYYNTYNDQLPTHDGVEMEEEIDDIDD